MLEEKHRTAVDQQGSENWDPDNWDSESWRPQNWDKQPRSWERVARCPFLLFWLPAFILLQFMAFFVVLWLDPQKFDVCDSVNPPGERPLQAIVAGIGLTASAALALWRLRWWRLLPALLLIGFFALMWVQLLEPKTC